MNYAELEPSSMENLLDESNNYVVAEHEMERRGLPPSDATNRLSQPSAVGSGIRGEGLCMCVFYSVATARQCFVRIFWCMFLLLVD